MKRWIPFVAGCMVLCLLMGMYTGSTSELGRLEAQNAVTAVTQTTIAVVNTDAGATVDGAKVNYSAAIIDTLGDDFSVVSPAMAASGFESGAYGAVITFPADVSTKVLSFNAERPEQVEIEFDINQNLSDRDYLDTFMKVVELEMSINTTLAGTYVSSIFNQVHLAQDQINQIFENDQLDMSSLEDIQLADFTASVDWDDVPDTTFEPTPADTSAFYAQVSDFAETVSSLYVESYGAASSDYSLMREGLFQLTEDFPRQEEEWLTQMSDWSQTTVDYGERLEAFAADVQAEQDSLTTWYGQVADWHDEVMSYRSGVVAWYQSVRHWFGDAEDWYSQYQAYLSDAAAYMDEVEEYRASLVGSVESVQSDLQTWRAQLGGYADTLTTQFGELSDYRATYNNYSDTLADFLTSVQTHQSDIEAYQADLETYRTSVETRQTDLETYRTDLGTYRTELAAYHSQLDAYQNGLTTWDAELQARRSDLQTTINSINEMRAGIAGLPPMPDPTDEEYLLNPSDYETAMADWYTALRTFAATIPDFTASSPAPEPPAEPELTSLPEPPAEPDMSNLPAPDH